MTESLSTSETVMNASSSSEQQQPEQQPNDLFLIDFQEIEKKIQGRLADKRNGFKQLVGLAHQLTLTWSADVEQAKERVLMIVDTLMSSYSHTAAATTDSRLVVDTLGQLVKQEFTAKANAAIYTPEIQLTITKYILKELDRQSRLLSPLVNKRAKYLVQNTQISIAMLVIYRFVNVFDSNKELIAPFFTVLDRLFSNLTIEQLKIHSLDFSNSLSNKKVFSIFVDIVSKDNISSKQFYIIYYILQFISKRNTTQPIVDSKFILNLYNKTVMSMTQQRLEDHRIFKSLFSQLDLEDVKNVILAPLTRLIKRDQEQMFKVFHLILENLKVDLSPITKSLLMPILVPILSNASSEKKIIKKTFALLFSKISDKTVASAVFTEDLTKSLTTAGSNSIQKINTLVAIGSLDSEKYSSTIVDKTLAKSVVTLISTYLEKELNKENKYKAFKVLGNWMRMVEELPEVTIKVMNNSLKMDDELIKGQVIRALAKSLGPNCIFQKKSTQLNQFTEIVNNIIKAVKNPKTCDPSTTMASLHFMLALSTTPTFQQKYTADKNNVQLLYSQQSFAHQQGFFARTAKKDHAIDFLIDLLKSVKLFPSVKANEKSVYSSLVSVLLHSQWSVRKESATKLRAITTSNDFPTLSNLLFGELSNTLLEESKATVAPAATGEEAVEKHYHYANALKAVLSKHLTSDLYPSLVLFAYHPHVNYSWKKCCTLIGKDVVSTLADHAQEISKYIFANGLNNKKIALYQRAYQLAIERLAQYKVPLLIESMVANLVKSLDFDQIRNITATQWGIYNTPEGTLYNEPTEQVIVSRSDVKTKKKTAEQIKDEEFKKRMDDKKKKESGEAEKVEKEKQKQLNTQAAIRKDVIETINTLKLAIESCVSLANVGHTAVFVGEYLSPVVIALFALIKEDLVHTDILSAYERLSVCIPARFKLSRSFARHCVYIMANIFLSNKSQLSEIQILSFLQKILTNLKETTVREGPFSGFVLNYFWPLIKNGLEKTISFTIQEISMDIIQRHTQQGQPYPRGSMIASLIIVVATASRLETVARNAIFQIINGVEITDIAELMQGIISPHQQVRAICLQAIEKIPAIYSPDFVWDEKYVGTLWFAKFDPEPATAALADKIWNSTNQNANPPENYLKVLHQSTFNTHSEVRKINAKALRAASSIYKEQIGSVLETLYEIYQVNFPDEIRETPVLIQNRISVASALAGIGNSVEDPEFMKSIFDWLMSTGLFDPREEIVSEFVATGANIIGDQGKLFTTELLQTFEAFLARPDDGTGKEDNIRANVVVLLGSLAKHMDASNPKVSIVMDKLIEALSIPSQSVQQSVSKCISQLIPSFKQQGDRVVPILLEKLKNTQSDYADRRGAAFGLAGTVKGLGISSLKNYKILEVLQSYVEDKRHPISRQGALFAFECLCNTIGRVFEPYVIHILPKLLVCFGDNNSEVRDATSEAAKAIMSQLSGHGVKIVLPALLKALDDRQWRTKEGSIELLGAMAFCAPKQLSSCLPTIVPKLTNVLNDTHTKVQEAAKEALSHIGSVIRNPEIQIHVPLLLKTYDDPEIHSKELLENLLNTNYVHTIDPASLSLIMPILERTLKERSSELKKMSCQIVGNLCSLTEPKELIPYLNILMPVMKNVLLDPIPEVRTICARALGLLVHGMGEENFSTLIPWLLETVKSDQGAVERSGAAQGLSEVLASLDISRFNSLINELLAMTKSPRPHVREGIMSIFIFTPISLGENFLPYLPRVLPTVLKGLADDSDPVREVCMRCGQSIVSRFAVSGIEVIVPALEKVLFDENWRIRLSCVQLFGDLLFKLAGTTASDVASGTVLGTSSGQDDDEDSDVITRNDIHKLLGKERLDRILSSLYMMRFDNNSSVRQKVLLIWKFIVNNTPKTLREILSTLIEMIISSIGSSNIEKRQISAKTLGDIVSKLSDRILPEILPILEKGLQSEQEETRQGVCIGLSEVINSARTQLLPYLGSVVTCISKALCDPLIDVREAAAKAFDYLYNTFGSKANNEILPSLIQLLDNSNPTVAENALDGLRQVVLVRSVVVLPVLVPKLLSRPLSSSNIKALAKLSKDAGEGLHTHLSTIIPSLIEAFTNPNIANASDIKDSAISICKSIDQTGLETLVPLLIEQTEVRLPNIRLGACQLIGEFYNGNNLDFEDFLDTLISSLLSLFNDPDTNVQLAANTALGFITKSIKKDNLSYLSTVQKGIQMLATDTYEDVKSIPGFCLPKGLASILPILLNGLMYGSSEQREQATNTLYTVINLTSQDALKPSVMQITGPLILVIGDKFPHQVKSAILNTLSLLITKCPVSMKIFLHQLQHIFIKCLGDQHKNVRNNAATALGLLMTLSASVDQLVTQLINGISTADSVSQEAKLRALQSILDKKPKIDQATLDKIIASIVEFLYQPSDDIRLLVAQAIGASSKCFSNLSELNQFIKTHLISPSQSVLSRYGKSLALGEIFKQSGKELIQGASPNMPTIINIIQTDCKDEKGPIRESSAFLAEAILTANASQYAGDLIPSLAHLINDQSSSVAITSLQILKRFCKVNPTLSKQYLSVIVPPTMNRLKERTNLPLKLASERTLVHSLQIFKESIVLDNFIKTIDQTLAQSILDYHKRVLIKLTPDSDTESQ
ncbi:hypothetical protein CYY_004066 [Polysphondylium violaceum]|uniref:TOG domain-containing protein n=1 Tax=Polysphondylium violaceum TaxID=133409 RepID=A0A8J4V5J7_9MYCE|nr:hypothetical protein CYY_004066 [Polysphondylium violaceum]